MPWHIKTKDDQYCVVKDSTGEELHCYSEKSKANKYLRALYANVNEGLAEFSMAIVKTSEKDGEMRWRSVNSDTGEDYYEERMSKELFLDMIARIKNPELIPMVFRNAVLEDGWKGGMPYVSIAHYRSGGGKNIPGEVKSLYVDGDKLKSTGTLFNTPLGKAVYKSLNKDVIEKRDDKVRISIAFIDLEHSHGDRFTFVRKTIGEKCPLCMEGIGDKIYKKGILVHLALTRKPANPRTDMEVEKSMTTKLEDAKSIVEDEEVLKDMELKSLADEALVIKAEKETPAEDDMEDCEEGDENCAKKHAEMHKSVSEETINIPASTPVSGTVPEVVAAVAATPIVPAEVITPEPTPLQKSIAAFEEKVAVLKSQGLKGDDALKELQSQFDELGNVVRAEFTPPPTVQEVAKQDLESTLRSLLAEMLPQALAQTVAPIQSELGELRALSLAGKQPVKKEKENPQPRSLQLNLQQKSVVEKLSEPANSFRSIARRSAGLD